MSDESGDRHVKPKSMISMRFIVVVATLALVAAFGGKWMMTQYFYFQRSTAGKSDATSTDGQESASGEQQPSGGQRGGAGRGRGFDREAFFAQRDGDGNGKLEGDEISERMADRVAEIDTDGDGAVSKEEFMEGMGRGRGNLGDGASSGASDSFAPDASAAESGPDGEVVEGGVHAGAKDSDP